MDKTVKNQHFVPQVYLKQFVNKKGNCYVYSKKNGSYFEANPRNILSKRYFYDINFEELMEYCKGEAELKGIPSIQIVEKIFSLCENNYTHIQKNIGSNQGWFSTITNNFLVYQLAAIQLIRTQKFRGFFEERLSKIVNQKFKSDMENVLLLRELLEIIDGGDSIILEYLLSSFGILRIGINNSNVPFITSDAPIIFISNFKNTGENVGYYPITPRFCILLCKPNYISSIDVMKDIVERMKKSKDTEALALKILNEMNSTSRHLNDELNKEEYISEREVEILNSAMFHEASEYMVSNISFKENDVFGIELDKLNDVSFSLNMKENRI